MEVLMGDIVVLLFTCCYPARQQAISSGQTPFLRKRSTDFGKIMSTFSLVVLINLRKPMSYGWHNPIISSIIWEEEIPERVESPTLSWNSASGIFSSHLISKNGLWHSIPLSPMCLRSLFWAVYISRILLNLKKKNRSCW